MNILFVCSAKAWGGNEKWTSMAMQALSLKHQVFFIGKSKELLNKFGQQNEAITLPFRSYIDVTTFSGLKRFINSHHIDVIVSTKKKEYWMCGIISRQLGIKHIIRLGANRKMNLPLWHRLNYQKLNDGIIVNSSFIEKHLLQYKFLQQHPIYRLYNGIPGFTSESALPNKPTQSKKFVIVSSGRITKLKGYHLFIDALSVLNDKIKSQLEIRIIGDGRNKKELIQQSTRLGLHNIVQFFSFVDNPTQLMQNANLFILFSIREGLSNSILEAMTLGIPVLSTDTGGIKEIIKEQQTGFLVKRSPEAIAQKLTELIKYKQNIRTVGENAFDLIKVKFAYDVFEKNINQLFNRL